MSLGAAVVAHRLPQTERLAGDTIDYAGDMSAAALAAAIRSLLESPDRARDLGAAARRRFDQQVDWRRAGGPRLVAAYDRLFGAPASRARAPASRHDRARRDVARDDRPRADERARADAHAAEDHRARADRRPALHDAFAAAPSRPSVCSSPPRSSLAGACR